MMNHDLWVVIAGGEKPSGLALEYIQEAKHLICADSGADFCFEQKIIPELIIGDLDSLSEIATDYFVQCGVKISVFPKSKDYTDTDLALAYCQNKEAKEIILVGALGKRIDHSLANVVLLVKYPNIVIANDISTLQLCRSYLKIEARKGDLMSLIPLSPIVKNIKLKGFLYPLENYNLLMRNNIGISNVFIENAGEIFVEFGELLVIYTKNEE